MKYKIHLDVYRGAEERPRYQTTYDVDEDAPLAAMTKGEQCLNVLLPDDEYAVALGAHPVVDPRPLSAYARVLDMAA